MQAEAIHKIFSDFAELLNTRFGRGILTTEDSVRYTLFASMLYNGLEPDGVILEFPHPTIARAQVDTWMPEFDGHNVAIEFKYDRDPPGGKNQPKTQKAGSAFRDLRRLELVNAHSKATCYFIYVTTKEMDVYFRNSANGHKELYDLLPGAYLNIRQNYFSDKPQTFMKYLEGPFEAKVSGVLKMSLSGDHFLRIYGVESL